MQFAQVRLVLINSLIDWRGHGCLDNRGSTVKVYQSFDFWKHMLGFRI